MSTTNDRKRKNTSPTEGEPDGKRAASATALAQLRQHTTVVADTGDFDSIAAFSPEDATTNPSLLLQVCQMEKYSELLSSTIAAAKKLSLSDDELIDEICDRLAIEFGLQILKIVPGKVSTEVDARLSFDKEKSIEKAKKIIRMYEERGIKRERILIKMATTWEGCQAALELEKEGIHCNLTLLFSFAQAVAAAQAGVTLISPFVGRIYDWYKKSTGKEYTGHEDPGVQSVKQIYNYYKKHAYKTVVMGASFRNTSEITALCGCDKLTISPKLLSELDSSTEVIDCCLSVEKAKAASGVEDDARMTEAMFHWKHNEDQMAVEKLSEGIRNFHKDGEKLKTFIKTKLKETAVSDDREIKTLSTASAGANSDAS
eukprot:GHVU01065453.1.p1 GENE.GHVU01065453.1~~GHVU01065453.1.p1  ORF type:complete len:396 (-),score=76.17 GHVU01065453.1:1252-2367(-)